jgi:hypothetical protein
MEAVMMHLPANRIGWMAAAISIGALTLAQAGEPAKTESQEVSIPFVDYRGTIRDWRPDGDRGVWVQDVRNQWYYARFMAPCIGVRFSEALHLKTGPTGQLDRWGSVLTRDAGTCMFTSFVRSDGPPKSRSRKSKEERPATVERTAPAEMPAGD